MGLVVEYGVGLEVEYGVGQAVGHGWGGRGVRVGYLSERQSAARLDEASALALPSALPPAACAVSPSWRGATPQRSAPLPSPLCFRGVVGRGWGLGWGRVGVVGGAW